MSISFDRIADRYDETRGGEERGRIFADEIDPYFGDAQRVLEVGVGTGIMAAALGRRGRTVVGIDISAQMLARAHERLGSRIGRADAHALPVPTAAVDGAYLVWVLHLVADPPAVVAECARVLRPGAQLVVIAGLPHTEDAGDMTEHSRALSAFHRSRPDTADAVVEWGQAAGLEHRAYKELVETHSSAPAEFADVIEKRSFSWIWDLDEQTWNEGVQPVIDNLRALPDPTRPRQVTFRRDLLVFAR